MNYTLNNGLYCTKGAYSHLLFGQLLLGLKSSIMGCAPIFRHCSRNSSHLYIIAGVNGPLRGVGAGQVFVCRT